MNRDDIIRITHEAGIEVVGEAVWKLCELVAAAEREACAKVCEDLVLAHPGRADLTADQCAASIRARDNK